jgi:hypothetical protein
MAKHKGDIKFLNPFLSLKAYQIRKGKDPLKGHLTNKNPHLLQQHISKLEIAYAYWNATNILYL